RKAAAAELRRSAARGHDPHHELADLTRRLDRSKAYDGAENISSAYAAFINDLRMEDMSELVAQQGFKATPRVGFYVGPERIATVGGRYGPPPTMRSRIVNHWLHQPVIKVSHDARSVSIRTRLEHFSTSISESGSFTSGMYNNQAVLENGVWKFWDITIDEYYFKSVSWAEGWSGANPRDPNAPPPEPSPVLTTYPPDLALSDMGERMEGFEGGTGEYVVWPDIVPMWFGYRNLVSGRVPEHYQSDCTPCEVRPGWGMTEHGYQLPPNGPSIDGVNVDPARHG
ncbi:MAG: nuclear transport factor 2 family protein, partial [Actinomycetia bacterium]|nr:nuclear transport factor 2 family protein [Actinomycetes bacterium]